MWHDAIATIDRAFPFTIRDVCSAATVNTHSSAVVVVVVVVVVVAAGRSPGTTLYMDKITYCLDADPRPTCVLDLDSASSSSSFSPHIHFENKALREEQNNHLLHDIRDSGASTDFRTWVLDSEQSGTVTATPRASIHAYTIDKRWRVIQWLLPEKKKLTLAPNGHNSPGEHHQTSAVSPKSDSSLNRKLKTPSPTATMPPADYPTCAK
jgi:hypothetical protein